MLTIHHSWNVKSRWKFSGFKKIRLENATRNFPFYISKLKKKWNKSLKAHYSNKMQVCVIKKSFILSTFMVEVGVSSEQFSSSHTISCFFCLLLPHVTFRTFSKFYSVFISIIAKLGPPSAMTTWSFAAHVYTIHTRIQILLSITDPHVIYMFPFK